MILLAVARSAWSHAAPALVPVGPLHGQGNRHEDSTRQEFVLRGAQLPKKSPIPALKSSFATTNCA
ncbi:MAG: hypothetical protein ABIZ80_04120 [Bryobacteraceae bacterium]